MAESRKTLLRVAGVGHTQRRISQAQTEGRLSKTASNLEKLSRCQTEEKISLSLSLYVFLNTIVLSGFKDQYLRNQER